MLGKDLTSFFWGYKKEVTRLFIGVEQKQVFENVRSYLDDKVKQNVENVPIDELDTSEKLKRWISED